MSSPLGCNNTTGQGLNMSAQLTFNTKKSPLNLCSPRSKLHHEGMMPLHEAIACAVDHGDRQLRQRRRRSILRLAIYECQIICNQLSRVQMLRSISSCWRFKCPWASTVTTAPIRLTYAMLRPLTVSEYYEKIKLGLHQSVVTIICGVLVGAQRFVTRLWCIICLVTRRIGEGVEDTSDQSPVNPPSGPNECNIVALKNLSMILDQLEDVKTLGTKHFCTLESQTKGAARGEEALTPSLLQVQHQSAKGQKTIRHPETRTEIPLLAPR